MHALVLWPVNANCPGFRGGIPEKKVSGFLTNTGTHNMFYSPSLGVHTYFIERREERFIDVWYQMVSFTYNQSTLF